MSTLTFVTAYFEIYPPNSNNKSREMRFENFAKIARTGIPILVFTDPNSLPCFNLFKDDSSCNLKFRVLPFNELETYKQTIQTEVTTLPETRCMKKDTLEFMILMNSKAELMKMAVDENPFNTTHFCWMDFSLLYVFKDVENSIQFLKDLSTKSFKPSVFAIPGCWEKGQGTSHIWNSINWRFCGGFFLADKESLISFWYMYRHAYKKIISKANRMTWETNIWHLMELDLGWQPNWFKADHNDSICRIPQEFLI